MKQPLPNASSDYVEFKERYVQFRTADGRDCHVMQVNWFQGADPFSHVMAWFAQAVDAGDGICRREHPWWTFGLTAKKFTLDWDSTRSQPTIGRTHC